MPRQARIVLPHEAHHVTQRGNYRMDVFDRDCNYQYYIELINEYALEYGIEIVAYCLMTNHVHFMDIDKNIETLKKKGLIERVGPEKGGHWEVIRK